MEEHASIVASRLRVGKMITINENYRLRKNGILLNIVSMGIMNLAPLINKFALSHIGAIPAALFNTLFVVLFSYLALRYRGKKVSFKNTNKILWLIGLFDALGVVSLYTSLSLITPVMVGFLGRLYTLFAIILSLIFLKEKISKRQAILMGIAIAGLFMFVYKDLDFSSVLGVITAIVYTFCFAVSNLLAKIATTTEDTHDIIFSNKLVSLGFILVYSALTGNLVFVNIDLIGMGYVFLASLFCNFIGLMLFYEGMRHVEFNLVNLIRSVGPILVVVYSWYFFPEPLSVTNVIGAVFLLGAILLLTTQSEYHKMTKVEELTTLEETQ